MAEPGFHASYRTVQKSGRGVGQGSDARPGQKVRPPTGADTKVANSNESGHGHHDKQQDGAKPSQAYLDGIVA